MSNKLDLILHGKFLFFLIMVTLLIILMASSADAQADMTGPVPSADSSGDSAEFYHDQVYMESMEKLTTLNKTSWLHVYDLENLVSTSAETCAEPDCVWLAAVSEETPDPVFCPRGYAVDGMACSGRYCDNIALHCRRYTSTPDSYDYDNVSEYWVSEERPNNAYPPQGQHWTVDWFVVGVKCKGRYCDNIQLYRKKNNPKLVNSGTCWFSNRWFSEEKDPFKGQISEDQSFDAHIYVAGLQCRGRYCDDMSLYYCATR